MAQSKHHTNSQKQETPERPSSYRPISLTSCICKLAGRLLQSRLAYLLEVNNILAPEQAGFRSGRCTEQQIARLGQGVMDAMKTKHSKKTVMVAVDMTTAYHRVNRNSLLHKLTDMHDVMSCKMSHHA